MGVSFLCLLTDLFDSPPFFLCPSSLSFFFFYCLFINIFFFRLGCSSAVSSWRVVVPLGRISPTRSCLFWRLLRAGPSCAEAGLGALCCLEEGRWALGSGTRPESSIVGSAASEARVRFCLRSDGAGDGATGTKLEAKRLAGCIKRFMPLGSGSGVWEPASQVGRRAVDPWRSFVAVCQRWRALDGVRSHPRRQCCESGGVLMKGLATAARKTRTH